MGADYTFPSGPEGAAPVSEITGGRGADLIIETTGMPPVIADAISMARLGAALLLFGITTATHAELPFYQLYFKELSLVSSRAAKSEDYPASIDLAARGIVKLAPLVTHVVPVTELEAAIGMLESDTDERMKIILENSW
jgi:threonine dehydrogenase-like Zn-dependent dehydrogenase